MRQVLLATTAAVALAFGTWDAAAQTDRADQPQTPPAATRDRPASAERSPPSLQQPDRAPGQAQKAPSGMPQQNLQAQPSQPRETSREPAQREPGAAGTQPRETQPGQAQQAPSGTQQAQPTQPRETPRERAQREPGAAGTQPRETQPGQAQQAPSGTQQQAQPTQRRAPAGERERRDQPEAGTTAAPARQPAERAGGGGGIVSTSVPIPEHQRVELSHRLASVDLHHVDRVNFSLTVGTVVPRSVQLFPVPAEIVAVVPAFRGFHYIAVRERIVIVEPRTLRIVTIIDRRGVREGFVGSAAPPRVAIVIPERKRVVIRERIHKITLHRAPRDVSFEVVVGAAVPAAVTLHAIPASIAAVHPDLRPYRYVVIEEQFVIVDPKVRRIAAILPF